MKFVAQILINALAIFLADYLVPGFNFDGDILGLLIAGLFHMESRGFIVQGCGLFDSIYYHDFPSSYNFCEEGEKNR